MPVVTGPITPAGNGSFPTNDSEFGKGGLHLVADVTARNAIPSGRRTVGMLARTNSDGAYWKLGSDLTSWTEAYIPPVLRGSSTYDAPSIAAGSRSSTTVTVTGAVVGDFVKASLTTLTTQELLISATVSATNTVTVTFFNPTGSSVDLASGTLKVICLR